MIDTNLDQWKVFYRVASFNATDEQRIKPRLLFFHAGYFPEAFLFSQLIESNSLEYLHMVNTRTLI